MVAGEDTDRFPKPDYSTSVFPENYNIDDFIVEKELTRGPQSRILLCKTRELEPENVLIKLYPRKREANSCRGVGEYAAIRSLNSGNIIKMIRYFELRDAILGSYFCIALPYYPNGDLNTVIQDCKTRNTLVPAADASRYAYYIAKGLNAVHDKNIIHCALKPSNILLSNDPKTLVISDFGFSKVVSESSDNVDVHKFCSPEMRQGQYGQPTDVWSYGCLLYALLTGKDVDLAEELQTARENDAEEELRQSLRNDMSSLRIYNNGLIDLVMSTLRIEPAERPKTLEILELDLFSTFKEEEDGTAECIICMVSPKTHACVPCGHKVLCEDNTCISMALQAGKCPICRVDVHDCIRIL
jgi:serine/threonine protein kinase